MTQKQKNIEKQKKIVVVGLLIFILLIVLGIMIFILSFKYKNDVLSNSNNNIVYYSEVKEDENKVLVVGVEDRNQNTNENYENEMPYYLKVNNEANVVTAYKKGKDGEYSVPVKAMICSIGTSTPTSGVYTMSIRYKWRALFGNVYGQYACRITGNILFHSVPYQKQDKSTLEWWEYDKLGTKASLGCVRLKVEDAKWIYDNCQAGTQVEFYYSPDPGPLGKPSAMKITEHESVRNWDPTDPDENNPWKEYLGGNNR